MAKRRRKKHKKKILPFQAVREFIATIISFIMENIVALIVVIALSVLVWWLFIYFHTDPLFSIHTVDITTTQFVPHAEILKISDIHDGDNIFLVDMKAIARKLEKIPRIKRAEIKRILPNTISFDIKERYACAQVQLGESKRYYLIDEDGYILSSSMSHPQPQLVVIKADFTDRQTFSAGDYFFPPVMKTTMNMIEMLKTHPVLENEDVESINIDKGLNLSIILKDGIEIRVGRQPYATLMKLEKVKEVLSETMRHSIKYIDLRFQDVVVKKR